ncbi:hypothetical protein GCM10010521_46950 [Streptomyces rameus]|uniref:Uncharacterized protein n=1 Tax=Streptomyces rameus TaxID=68261 RepID=A0ABP6NN60_9ACTN
MLDAAKGVALLVGDPDAAAAGADRLCTGTTGRSAAATGARTPYATATADSGPVSGPSPGCCARPESRGLRAREAGGKG